ncbi:TonB-dependent receptor [Shimwellia pseudoproteus]|nr:TonB-dependent receptor [Shimwellia pseudoproteus]
MPSARGSLPVIVIATSLASPLAAGAADTLIVTDNSPQAPATAQLSPGSASRLAVSDRQVPRHTETISQQTITTSGNRTLTDIVETLPGLSGTTSPTLSNSVSLRGFTPVAWLYDGVLTPGSTLQGGDPVHYESIDVLYGTGSVLNGLSPAGGSINLISRKASFRPQPLELDYGWSSFASHRAHFGAGGALVDHLAAGRIDISTSSTGSQVHDVRQRPLRVTGSLLLTPTDNTQLTFALDRMLEDTHNPYFGTPFINGKLATHQRYTNYNNLDKAWIRSRATSFQATQSWFATPQLSVENKFYYYTGFREWHNAERYYPSATRPGELTRDSFGDLAHDDKLTGDRVTLNVNGTLGRMDNQLMAGADISKRQFSYFSNGFAGEDSIPVVNPPRRPFSSGNAPRRSAVRHITQNQYALFLEDRLGLTDTLGLLGQLRYSAVDMHWNFQQLNQRISQRYHFVSVGIGPSWDVTDNLTLYANYSTGKEPGEDIFFIGPAQTSLPLTAVQQYESGVKASLPGNRGDLKLAVYQLEKKHLYQQDELQAGRWNAVGKQTSRGVELSGALRPLDSLTLAGNLAYTHARFNSYRQGGQDLSGNTPRYVPRWTANLSARYMATPKLGLGTQMHYVGSSYNNDANTVKMASYTTVDASVDYQILPGVTVGSRVRNLTDKTYAWQRTYATQALIAPGRTWEAFVNMRF